MKIKAHFLSFLILAVPIFLNAEGHKERMIEINIPNTPYDSELDQPIPEHVFKNDIQKNIEAYAGSYYSVDHNGDPDDEGNDPYYEQTLIITVKKGQVSATYAATSPNNPPHNDSPETNLTNVSLRGNRFEARTHFGTSIEGRFVTAAIGRHKLKGMLDESWNYFRVKIK
jgi:hypothetical protein